MLNLKLPTDPRWVNLAEKSIEEILTDHAYCEQKAATYCISLIQQFSDREALVDKLSPVVTEEWGHFRQVLREIRNRQLSLGPQRRDLYVNNLIEFQRKGGSQDQRLLEKLLTCALIEARSCERFRILSIGLNDDYLRQFYHHFMVSEAGHYRMFIDLAYTYAGQEKARARWEEYLTYEADMISKLEVRGDRMH